MNTKGPIGIFDSGYGGLTILKAITQQMPEYDYHYLGDNARAPYINILYRLLNGFSVKDVVWSF